MHSLDNILGYWMLNEMVHVFTITLEKDKAKDCRDSWH
jgi:hypothetical protein